MNPGTGSLPSHISLEHLESLSTAFNYWGHSLILQAWKSGGL